MIKRVAATIINPEDIGTSFLVQQVAGQYKFYNFEVLADQTPLASVLWKLRHEVGIDVDQLRLYDSVVAQSETENISLFVFNHLKVDASVRKACGRQGLIFVSASKLHGLFESVKVSTMPSFEKLSK